MLIMAPVAIRTFQVSKFFVLLELLRDGLEFTRALGVLTTTFILPGVKILSLACAG